MPQEQIERIIGSSGKVNGGVYQFSVACPEKITGGGTDVLPSMGVAHAINFQPTGGGVSNVEKGVGLSSLIQLAWRWQVGAKMVTFRVDM